MCMWKVAFNCLSIDEKVRSVGIPIVSACNYCSIRGIEDMDHILNKCDFASNLWRKVSDEVRVPLLAHLRSLGIPVKLLHEASGHVMTVELKSGELYRGSMIECEDNWNCQLESITYTAKDGKISQLEHIFIRGSKVRFVVIPDILKNAPMFKRLDARIKGESSSIGVKRGRAVAMWAKATTVGRGATGGRGVVPPVKR
ncbi:hypothetical protein EZV62_011564 [Acer yangbiense]|uniref:Small nuclear ribonucleoprotein Sm D3 n=1 Tax=Acer yangbiense TaxID=1000413 RepID=A0A5C7I5G9_9ROSI|nr:hypothetical protein EZV62_011564 [Acer yangbiense]